MEEVRARLNDDARFFAELAIDDNTVAHWRRRRGVPEPQLVKLRRLAEELASDEEKRRDQGLALIAEGLALATRVRTKKKGKDSGRSGSLRPPTPQAPRPPRMDAPPQIRRGRDHLLDRTSTEAAMKLAMTLACLLALTLTGCAQKWYLYRTTGITREEAARDTYQCTQESRTSWSGGGTGALGLALMGAAASNAETQAKRLYVMCMEARGYHYTTDRDQMMREHNPVGAGREVTLHKRHGQPSVDQELQKGAEPWKRKRALAELPNFAPASRWPSAESSVQPTRPDRSMPSWSSG
jgi:hypothetical protein